MELSRQLANFWGGKPFKVYSTPFDCCLCEKDQDHPEEVGTVVEPDISVVRDRNKINMCGCKGVLDLAIEILSLLTLRRDRFVKLRLYQRAKVREYRCISVRRYWNIMSL